MITAVDTSVLFDVFRADPVHGAGSRAALQRCAAEGGVIASDIVWAEVLAIFDVPADGVAALTAGLVEFVPLDASAAAAAGAAWRNYRRAGGPRTRIVADFLIGAHALRHADRLLTRDRGFHRKYFRGLKVLDPTRMS